MSVSIKNETNTPFTINFVVVDDPDLNGYIYRQHLEEDVSTFVYSSTEVSRDPIALFKEAYRVMRVTLHDEDSTTLVFFHDEVRNYAENLYTDTSAWELRIEEDIQDGPVIIWNYEFIIREELIER